MSETKFIKDLTPTQCEEISRFFFNGDKTARSIYAQLHGERSLTKEVAVAAQMYLDFEVSADTTRAQLLKEYANRYRNLSMADFERMQFVGENQENPLVEVFEGVDLTPEQKFANVQRAGVEL